MHPGLAPPSEMKLVVKLLGDAEVVLGELIRRFNSVLFVFCLAVLAVRSSLLFPCSLGVSAGIFEPFPTL